MTVRHCSDTRVSILQLEQSPPDRISVDKVILPPPPNDSQTPLPTGAISVAIFAEAIRFLNLRQVALNVDDARNTFRNVTGLIL